MDEQSVSFGMRDAIRIDRAVNAVEQSITGRPTPRKQRLAITGGSGAPRIRFTILSTAFSEVLGQVGCDFVNARVNYISCDANGVEVGDEVRIFDPEYCHFGLPIDLLVGLCGTATMMDAAEFVRTRLYMPDCLYVLDGQDCLWMIDTLCCSEEEEILT